MSLLEMSENRYPSTMVCSCSIHACDLCTLRSRPPPPSSDFITSLHMPATRSRHFTSRPCAPHAPTRPTHPGALLSAARFVARFGRQNTKPTHEQAVPTL